MKKLILIYTFLILSLCLLFLPTTFYTQFNSRGEPREALSAQAMLEKGEWILPKRYDQEFIAKPPMTYWLMSLASTPQGYVSEFSSRIPSVILSIITICLLFYALQRSISITYALYTVIILLCSILWYRSSIIARIDIILASFTSSCLLLFFLWTEKFCKGLVLPLLISLLISFSILTKGPIGFILPGFIFTCYLIFLKYNFFKIFKILSYIFIPAILISSFWYIAAFYSEGDSFLDVVLLENFKRFTSTMQKVKQPHEHSFLYLFGTLFAGWLPLSLAVFILPYKNLYKFLKRKMPALNNLKSTVIKVSADTPKIIIFSILISITFIGFYSIPASKRAEYLLPCYPFLAILICYLFFEFKNISISIVRKILFITTTIILTVYLLIFLALIIPNSLIESVFSSKKSLKILFISENLKLLFSSVSFLSILSIIIPFFLVLIFLIQSRKLKFKTQIYIGVVSYFLFLFSITTFILPNFANKLSAKHFALEVKDNLPNLDQLYSLNRFYGLNFYLHGKLKLISEDQEGLPKPAYIFIRSSDEEKFREKFELEYGLKEILVSKNWIRKIGERLILIEVK